MHTAARMPSQTADIVGSAFDDSMINNRSVSQMGAEREAFDEIFNPLFDRREARYPDYSRSDTLQEANQYYSLKKSDALGGRYARNDREARYAAIVAKSKDADHIPTLDDVYDLAASKAQSTRERAHMDMVYTVSESPRMAMFAGAAGASMADPVVLASIAGSVPVLLSRSILKVAGAEAFINASSEAVIQQGVAEWQKAQGVEYTADDRAAAVGMAGLIGAIFGGGMSVGYRAFGGANKALFQGVDGYMESVSRIIAAGNEITMADIIALRSMDPGLAIRQPVTEIPTQEAFLRADNSLNSQFIEESTGENPWTVTSVSSRVVGTSQDMDMPADLKHIMVASAMDNHLAMNNPYRHTPTYGTEYDQIVYNSSQQRAINDAHQKNINGAITAINRGEDPTPQHLEALSLELKLGDTNAHIPKVRDIIARGMKLTLKSGPYRDHLTQVIGELVADKLNAMVKAVDLPADGVRLKVTMKKPRGDADKINAKRGRLNEESKKHTADIKAARKANKELERNAKATEEQSEKDWYLKQAQKNLRKIDSMIEKRAKLQAEMREIPKALKDLRESQSAYVAHASKVAETNAALDALDDLLDLSTGKIPRRLVPLRDRLDGAYQQARKADLPGEWSAQAESFLSLNPGFRGKKFGAQFDPNEAVISNPFQKPVGEPIRTVAERKAIRAALDAEAERLPPDMTFEFEGEQITVQQMIDADAAIAQELDGIVACAIKSTPV
jgi:hypothetical protein